MELPLESRYPFLRTPDDQSLKAFKDIFAFLRVELELPVRLTWSRGIVGTSIARADVKLSDESGEIINTTTWDHDSRTWYGSYVVHEWTDGANVIRVIAVTPGTAAAPLVSDIELDPRAYEQRPEGVTAVQVEENSTTGVVTLSGGYNTELEVDDTAKAITIDQTAGGGLGEFPGCDDLDIALRTLAGQGPDKYGDLSLQSFFCYRIGNPAPAVISIASDCPPCYSCKQITNGYLSLTSINERWGKLRDRTGVIREDYMGALDRWNAQKACRENQPVRVALLQGGSQCLSVSVAGGNTSDHCLENVSLTVELTADVPGELDPDQALWYPADGKPVLRRSPSGSWPNFCSSWEQVRPRLTAKASYAFRFPVDMTGTTVVAVARMYVGGKLVIGGEWRYELVW